MKLIQWFGGFFEDQVDRSSSKRLTLYIFTFIFYIEVKANIKGVLISQEIIIATIGVILFCLGAITSEFFKDKFSSASATKVIEKSETKTEG